MIEVSPPGATQNVFKILKKVFDVFKFFFLKGRDRDLS